jgi:DNA-binding Lrp family transcriptional regulator
VDDLDRAILDVIQDEFPVCASPYDEIARRAGTTPEDAERRVAAMREGGVIRRLGAIVDSRAIGMVTTLVGADVEADAVEAVAAHVDSFPEVTHCYLREGRPALWFTLVAVSQERIDAALAEVRTLPGVHSVMEFPATRVFKLGVKVKAGSSPPRHQGHEGSLESWRPGGRGRSPGEGKASLSDAERAILRELAEDLPRRARPYAEIASRADLGEDEVLATIRGLLERGVIRRVAAIVRDRKLGYEGNAMVAWQVPPEKVEQAGAAAAARPEISHAYARRTTPEWPYNLYTMIHAKTRAEAMAVVDELAPSIGATDRKALFTVREFTKRRPDYSGVLGGGCEARTPRTEGA